MTRVQVTACRHFGARKLAAMRTPELDRMSAARNVLLTTSSADGTSSTTAEWVAREGDHLYLIVDDASETARNIKANPDVELAPCDRSGKAQGGTTQAQAELVVDQAGVSRTRDLLRRRYGLVWPMLDIVLRVTRQRPEHYAAVRLTIPT